MQISVDFKFVKTATLKGPTESPRTWYATFTPSFVNWGFHRGWKFRLVEIHTHEIKYRWRDRKKRIRTNGLLFHQNDRDNEENPSRTLFVISARGIHNTPI